MSKTEHKKIIKLRPLSKNKSERRAVSQLLSNLQDYSYVDAVEVFEVFDDEIDEFSTRKQLKNR